MVHLSQVEQGVAECLFPKAHPYLERPLVIRRKREPFRAYIFHISIVLLQVVVDLDRFQYLCLRFWLLKQRLVNIEVFDLSIQTLSQTHVATNLPIGHLSHQAPYLQHAALKHIN